MLESMTIIMYTIAFIFTLLMLLSNREQPIFGILAFSVWFMTAAFVISIDVPYSHLYDNAANDNYLVVSGLSSSTSAAPLRWFSMGMGFICLGYTFILFIQMLYTMLKKSKDRRETGP